MVKCIECNNNKGIERSKIDKCLCKDCYKLDKYTLIVKTKAKNEYLLTDFDLEFLDEYYGTGAFGNGQATYYIKEQLIQEACNIYDVLPEQLDNKLNEIKNQKRIKKEQRDELIKQNKIIKKNKRESKLKEKLENAGLELRNDSVLCKKYIENTSEYSIKEIVNRMCQMKYLFEYCNMDECKTDAYEEHQEELNAGYFPDCSVFERAEDIALKKYSNGHYPKIFPWQIK
jgi:hypothetical protein